MKFTILGFSQERVLSLVKTIRDKNDKDKTIQLDVTDLLIIREVADFMNRKKIIKYSFEDKTFFSVKYSAIMEDLPILNIKKQALADRIDKIAMLGVLEKKVVKDSNGTFTLFRIGEEYEKLIYSPTDSEIQGGSYPTTNGFVSNYDPKYSSTNNSSTITKEIDKSISKDASEKTWREDFSIYQSMVIEAKDKILADQKFKAYIEQYYPNSDYQASINKMLEGFWNTEEGWMWVRKHRKGKTINMYTTLKKNLDKRSSIVYKSNSYQKRDTAPKINVVNLNPEVKPIDDEGTLSDGSILKGGHRYYWSNLYGRLVSVPLNASPRPEGDMYEYDIKLGWYECK